MKPLLFISFLALFSLRLLADEAKKPEPIQLYGSKPLATYDQVKQKFTYAKGVDSETVAEQMMIEYLTLQNKFLELQKSCQPKAPTVKMSEKEFKKALEDGAKKGK